MKKVICCRTHFITHHTEFALGDLLRGMSGIKDATVSKAISAVTSQDIDTRFIEAMFINKYHFACCFTWARHI